MIKRKFKKDERKKVPVNILAAAIATLFGGGVIAFLYFYLENIFLTGSLILILFVLDYFLLTSSKKKENVEQEKLEKSFAEAFSYFSIFVETGLPVYNALQATIPFAKNGLAEKMNTLLLDIDQDKSIEPYIRFSEAFSSLAIRQVMLSIYKMSQEGGSESYLLQFRTLFASFAYENRKAKLLQLESRMNSVSIFPLIASALLMALIAIGIVTILGGVMNGI